MELAACAVPMLFWMLPLHGASGRRGEMGKGSEHVNGAKPFLAQPRCFTEQTQLLTWMMV